MSFQSSSLDDQISEGNPNEDLFTTADYNSVNNANLLKDIESLIENMEKKQTKDSDSLMLRNIDNILSNIKLNESRPHSPQSNLSAEPIRMKSPIMLLTRSDDKVNGDRNISDNIRSFMSNNIQDIVPDLVSQVEQEITTGFDGEIAALELGYLDDLDAFLRSRHDEEFDERNRSPLVPTASLIESGHEQFLRDRHDEEFNERTTSPPPADVDENLDEGNNDDNIDDFFRARHDVEYLEVSVEGDTASHDSITTPSQVDGVNGGNLIVAASSSEHKSSNEPSVMDSEVTNSVNGSQQIEPLKYKSSFNLKILKQPPKKTKSERMFKKRNSLILAEALLGRTIEPRARPRSFHDDGISSHGSDVNINHRGVIERKSEGNPSQINASGSSSSARITGGVEVSEINESSAPASNQTLETTIETVDEIVINDESEAPPARVINDSSARASMNATSDSRGDESEVAQALPAPQNLSDLVEDTQRLIKQMKDEINAIYVSDEEEFSSGEGTEYSDEWVEGFEAEEDEFSDVEESEVYEDWSNEFVESDYVETTLIEDSYADEHANASGDAEDSGGLPRIIVGDIPAANETEAAGPESVVHGKLALTPMTSNHFKVDANIGSDEALNDNDGNLNNSASLHAQEANDDEVARVSERDEAEAPASSSTANANIINNEIKGATSSIKGIVSEAINDVISAISFDEAENIASQAGDADNRADSSVDNPVSLLPEATRKVAESITSAAVEMEIASEGATMSGGEEENVESQDPLMQEERESTQLNEVNVSGDATQAVSEIAVDQAENVQNQVAAALAVENVIENSSSGGAESQIDAVEETQTLTQSDATQVGAESQSSGEKSTPNATEAEESHSAMKQPQSSENLGQAQTAVEASQSAMTETTLSMDEAGEPQSTVEQSQSALDAQPESVNSTQKPKGAVAKTKIPKNVKRKSSMVKTLSDEQTESPSSKSKSSSPEKIKEPPKRSDSTSQDKIPKQTPSTRKNSLDTGAKKKTPFGLLATSNVKNLQNQFLNKTPTAPATTAKTLPTKLKPSKLTPPKAPAPTFANKLTKLITPSSTKGLDDKSNHSDVAKELVRDHSKDVVPEKKYMEHCFSDEYPTTTDDEDDDEEDNAVKKSARSFVLKKPPNESDDETSDVTRVYLLFIVVTKIKKNFFSLLQTSSAKSQQIPNRGFGAESLSG